MKSGSQQNDVDSSSGRSFSGSFRKFKAGFSRSDPDASPVLSFDGSFKKSSSAVSVQSISGMSASMNTVHTSRRLLKGLKDCAKKLVDKESFAQNLEDWVYQNSNEDTFKSPFSIDELHKLDLALEGVLFQQLYRMPCSPYALVDQREDKYLALEDEYLALEDFLHAIVNGLWRTFWQKSGPLPFFLSCPRQHRSKFYTVEKAISRRRVEELSGVALISRNGSDLQAYWDQTVVFALFRSDILSGTESMLSSSSICDALFHCVHILISRSLSRSSVVANDSVYILVLDSIFGAVVKLGGDLSKLELNSGNVYQSVSDWVKNDAEIEVSSADRIWNKLGNANWGDLGTLQILLAMFHSIAYWNGPPRKSIASLASDHSLRLQKRRIKFRVVDSENALVPYQTDSLQHGEIVELDQNDNQSLRKQATRLKLRPGDVLLLDDQQKSFQIQESLGNHYSYSAVSVDCPTELLTLYVGAHPSRLEPSWEDMSLWYQLQRQTKVLNILKQQGVSSKNLPEIVASGPILHSGYCKKQSPKGRCDHPWCGTPILVTSPVGEPISLLDVPVLCDEALRCCRDCLSALRSAAMANVQHGDICPENVIRVLEMQGSRSSFFYMPISWGRAVLEDRDSPAINLEFSSSYALQHGKLCPSSDAESLVYLLFAICGGMLEQQDSIESALQWRETSWAKRVIQQHLGEVSALLKAFADYVDSLCGTPYPVDYDIWLKRLNRAVDGSMDRGKMVEELALTLRLEEVAESSGISGGGP